MNVTDGTPPRPAPHPAAGTTKRTLSPAQRDALALFQRIRYGRIPLLRVSGGLPVLGGGLTWRRTVKVAGENAPHPFARRADFDLPEEFRAFFRLLGDLGDAVLRDIEVRNGFPFRFDVEESLAG